MKKRAFWTVSNRWVDRRSRLIPSVGREALTAWMVALALGLTGSMLLPTRSDAQEGGPQCLLCHQSMVYGDLDQDNENEWYWLHAFDLESAEACAESQGEMCKACGWESVCHGMDEEMEEINIGQCHEECIPAFALRDVDRTVTTLLAAQLDSRTGPTLVERVALEPSLVYQVSENAVALIGCEGVVKRWTLDESARTYFAASMIELRSS